MNDVPPQFKEDVSEAVAKATQTLIQEAVEAGIPGVHKGMKTASIIEVNGEYYEVRFAYTPLIELDDPKEVEQ